MSKTIVLFDDDASMRAQMVEHLGASDFRILEFESDQTFEEGLTYELILERYLEQKIIDGLDVILIVCDKELGKLPHFAGLSATVVSSACRNIGLPFCQYSRRPKYTRRESKIFESLARWDSEEITLTGASAIEFASQAKILAQGFDLIENSISDQALTRPAEELAKIMGSPDASSSLSLYASGDQSVMTEIFAYSALDDSDGLKTIRKRRTRILGNWLLLSILRFPGILVDSVACASLLNISVSDFEGNEAVRAVFSDFLYKGPFSDLSNWWWRDKLEEFVLDSNAIDGLDLVKNKGLTATPCLDSLTQERAGYVCMINHTPVSRNNSRGGIAWFPAGADLARIENSTYDKLNALVDI